MFGYTGESKKEFRKVFGIREHCWERFSSYRLWLAPNSIILAISPTNQGITTTNAIKLANTVDPSGERTFGILTKLDLMDKGTTALDMRRRLIGIGLRFLS
ncbi:hypothetical protein CTI12_AA138460 [Artemisia annua]|uniref:Dynamin N-terminal domain-containing protein n=1 Tax=Artemisia annua TaxID=35608 RepID=A0A2U1PM29_ARTAN|nr:hypothetical protein CTI12_AA138460 [Artemisia annua]